MPLSNYLMQGMTVASIKKHPSLVYLYAVLGLGCGLATFYTLRLAIRNPDVVFDKKNNPYPWQKYDATTQYKFYSIGQKYAALKKDPARPEL